MLVPTTKLISLVGQGLALAAVMKIEITKRVRTMLFPTIEIKNHFRRAIVVCPNKFSENFKKPAIFTF